MTREQSLPLLRRLSWTADASSLYDALRGRPYSFWLDSSLATGEEGRFSLLGSDPYLILKSWGRTVSLSTPGERAPQLLEGDPWEVAADLYRRFSTFPPGVLPFSGGVVGFWGYELGRHLEQSPSLAVDDLRLPDCVLGFYDTAALIDHREGSVLLISSGHSPGGEEAPARRAVRRMVELEALLSTPRRFTKGEKEAAFRPLVQANFTRRAYLEAVERAKDFIAAGDIYQVNLSQRLEARPAPPAWLFYQRLRRLSPAPFSCFLNYPELQLASSSPERFLKVEGGRVTTRPIKGTRPRGSDPRSDARLRRELWESEKDRAELTMITDLLRNDLGRVCRLGSVQVPELFRLEEYATVFHLVSTITGELGEGKDAFDLLKACFPGGSITGAPKVRSMQIIEELEPVRRGPYTGSVGYLSFNGNADLNIIIRTAVFSNDAVYFQVGGGLTADSNPLAEYQETLDKARAFFLALSPGQEVEIPVE